jgi:hypothetical protein
MDETTLQTRIEYEISVEKVVRSVETGEKQYSLSNIIYQQVVDKIDLPIIAKIINDTDKHD